MRRLLLLLTSLCAVACDDGDSPGSCGPIPQTCNGYPIEYGDYDPETCPDSMYCVCADGEWRVFFCDEGPREDGGVPDATPADAGPPDAAATTLE